MVAEPENLILSILREMRADMERRFNAVDARFDAVDDKFAAVTKRLDGMKGALIGESVLGRYAAAEVEERLELMDERLKVLEARQ